MEDYYMHEAGEPANGRLSADEVDEHPEPFNDKPEDVWEEVEPTDREWELMGHIIGCLNCDDTGMETNTVPCCKCNSELFDQHVQRSAGTGRLKMDLDGVPY